MHLNLGERVYLDGRQQLYALLEAHFGGQPRVDFWATLHGSLEESYRGALWADFWCRHET